LVVRGVYDFYEEVWKGFSNPSLTGLSTGHSRRIRVGSMLPVDAIIRLSDVDGIRATTTGMMRAQVDIP
jgi:hypothetical protein